MTESSEPLISIVILNYNAGKLLLECIESIYQSQNNNFEVILTKIAADGLDKSWLGVPVDQKMFNKLMVLNKEIGLNVAGEGGEFESAVLDCPLFLKRIELEKFKINEESINVATMTINKAKLVKK